MGKKKGGILSAVACAGLAVAMATLLDVFVPWLPFSGVISLVAVYLFYAQKRRVSPLMFVLGYVILQILLTYTVLGALFSVVGVL